MARKNKKGRKNYRFDTAGGAYIGGDVNAGGDFIGRDKVTNIHHHYPAGKQRRNNSSQQQKMQKVETEVTDRVVKPVQRRFPIVIGLAATQVFLSPLMLAVPEYLPIWLLPSGVLFVLYRIENRRIEKQLRVSGFYDDLSVDQRKRLIDSLQRQMQGNRFIQWYVAAVMKFCVKTDKRQLSNKRWRRKW